MSSLAVMGLCARASVWGLSHENAVQGMLHYIHALKIVGVVLAANKSLTWSSFLLVWLTHSGTTCIGAQLSRPNSYLLNAVRQTAGHHQKEEGRAYKNATLNAS